MSYHKEYYRKNREHLLAYHKEWREKNREKVRSYNREWKKNNPEKHATYQREWRKNNPRKYMKHEPGTTATERHRIKRQKNLDLWKPIIQEHFGEIKCSICGYDKCFAALTFHHRDSETKEQNISRILQNKPNEERITELKKCDLLCFNCHMEKTHS